MKGAHCLQVEQAQGKTLDVKSSVTLRSISTTRNTYTTLTAVNNYGISNRSQNCR